MKNIQSVILAVPLCLFPSLNSAQPLTFSKVLYDSALSGINAFSVVPFFDTGYLLAGETSYDGGLICKIDTTGNLLWSKKADTYSRFNHMIITHDSSFVLVGSVANSNGDGDAFILKVDSAGKLLWQTAVGGANGETALFVQQTYDKGFVITGFSAGYYSGVYSQIIAAKFDSAGGLEWSKFYIGGDNRNWGSSIKQTPDSGYIITGYMENYSPYDPFTFLMKLNSSGNLLWTKKISHLNPEFSFGNDVMVLNNGFLLYYNLGNRFGLIKTNFNANILWAKVYNPGSISGDMHQTAPKIHLTSDKNYTFIHGSCWGSSLIKTDTSGNIIYGNVLFLDAVDLTESGDKGYLLLGNGPMCALKTFEILSPQIGIIKTDSVGYEKDCITDSANVISLTDTIIDTFIVVDQYQWGQINLSQVSMIPVPIYVDQGCVDMGSGIDSNIHEPAFYIFPNPSEGKFRIKFELAGKSSFDLKILDVFGRTIYRENRPAVQGTFQKEIDLTGFPKGIYFL